MKKKLTISFTGNRPQKVAWLAKPTSKNYRNLLMHLNIVLEDFYRQGFRHFISGMALGADTIAVRCVLQLKKAHPKITLECALPCKNQSASWSDKDKRAYDIILAKADIITYVSQESSKYCMFLRNRYLVDNANQVIALWNNEKKGGTWYTVDYANKQKKGVIIIPLVNKFKPLVPLKELEKGFSILH